MIRPNEINHEVGKNVGTDYFKGFINFKVQLRETTTDGTQTTNNYVTHQNHYETTLLRLIIYHWQQQQKVCLETGFLTRTNSKSDI